jgi:hypothetical protein
MLVVCCHTYITLTMQMCGQANLLFNLPLFQAGSANMP